MTHPYDTATKDYFESEPEAWALLAGVQVARSDLRVEDTDLSMVDTATDKVLRLFVDAPNEYVLLFEFQAGWDGTLSSAIALRWGALRKRFDVPVGCVVILLKRKADQPAFAEEGLPQLNPLTGETWRLPCRFIRLWELDPEDLLSSGSLTLAGLAPVANVSSAELESIVERLKDRLLEDPDSELAKKVYVGSRLLMGLRYDEAVIRSLYGENFMAWWSESSVYQAALKDGEKIGVRKGVKKGVRKGVRKGVKKGLETGVKQGALATLRSAIKDLGEKRFGAIPEDRAAELEAMDDQTRLKNLLDNILTAESWERLFGK